MDLDDLPEHRTEAVPPDELFTDGDNPNEQNDATFGNLIDGMRSKGWVGGEIVANTGELPGYDGDAEGLLCDGEHRWRAAQELGLSEVPVKFVDFEDDADRRYWRQHLNKTTGEHDTKRDALEYDYLLNHGRGDDVQALTNAADEDLDELLAEIRVDRSSTPFYEYDTEHNVYFEDCVEGMAERLDDDSVDCVITDPPYGIETQDMGYIQNPGGVAEANDYSAYDWDDEPLNDEALDQIFRVSESQIICGGNYIADRVPPSRCWVSWDKTGGMTSSDFADTELIWTSFDRPARIYREKWRGMLTDSDETRHHPTQKPVALMEYLITEFTEPGDTVLDPFMGSGTTAVAAIQNDRNYVGFEIDEDNYRPVIERRISEAKRQMDSPQNTSDEQAEADD